MKRRLGETKEEQGPMGDDEGEKALEKLASTYIKEDATGKVILDTSATDFFDKMTAYRKNEEIREHMRARMAEEEEQANKLQKEQIASAAQASALLASESASTSNSPSTSLSPPSSACAPHAERNKGRQSVSGASPGFSTTEERGAGRDRKQSIVLQKLEASGGYALGSSGSLPATNLNIGAIDGNDHPPAGATVSKNREIQSTLLKHGHERDLAKDLAALGTSTSNMVSSSGKDGNTSPKKGEKPKPSHKDLNMFVPPGGPLVIGTVKYGIPYGLGLKGSGLTKPMNMSEVVSFQESLSNPSKQPLHHFLHKQREEDAKVVSEKEVSIAGHKKDKSEAQHEKEHASAKTAEIDSGLSSHVLAMLREEEVSLHGSDVSTPFHSSRVSLGQDSSVEGDGLSQSSLTRGLEEVHGQLARSLQVQARDNAKMASRVLTRYQEQRLKYNQVQAEYEANEKAHEPWMDAYKWGLHDDIGLDIDAKFMQKQLAEKAIRLMMFYIMEVQLKNAFTFLRDQTRRVANAKLLNAAATINRVGRGMLARNKCKLLMRMMRERLEAQRKKEKYAAAYQRKMGRIITRNVRLYAKMRVVKQNLRKRRAATLVQRIVRGKLARVFCA